MPILSRGPPEPSWEVVDYQEISAVPTYYGEDVEITAVSVHSVSRTYTFDAPSSSSSPPPSASSSPRGSFLKALRRRSCDKSPSFHQLNLRSTSQNADDSDSRSNHSSSGASYHSRKSSEHEFEGTHEKHISMREAVVMARDQLLKSEVMKQAGGDCLLTEGWSITRLRKGGCYRLKIRYFGRPGRAVFQSPSASLPPKDPPFMDMLQSPWY
ncbi:hypothetical protein FRB94_011102 [Tulasnella sp. JGI-2019a]|nr:hypothetical protein FRB94_011102 [Tulasnella sp. JGI-2019a]